MVDAEAVEDGGVEVVGVNRVSDNVVAEFVCFTVGDAAFPFLR